MSAKKDLLDFLMTMCDENNVCQQECYVQLTSHAIRIGVGDKLLIKGMMVYVEGAPKEERQSVCMFDWTAVESVQWIQDV